MNRWFGFCGLCALLLFSGRMAIAQPITQPVALKVARVEIRHVGPPAASDAVIRANIRTKPGDLYRPEGTTEDINNLYATGLFYNIRVTPERIEEGMVLIYSVQGLPRLTDITFQGNQKLKDSKIRKKLSSKIGEPLDERKLFTDSQAIKEMYQKSGYPGTEVRATSSITEETGRGVVTFEITESPKIKIARVEFPGAQAFSEKELRKVIKKSLRNYWMFSWLTRSGLFKDDKFAEAKEKLTMFYRDKGYIDFELKDVQFERPTPNTMVIRFHVYEGRQYRVGNITFKGTTMMPTNFVSAGFDPGPMPPPGPERTAWQESQGLLRAFPMREGEIFTLRNLGRNIEAVENFYGIKGHIDVVTSTGGLRVRRIANTEAGTMDLEFEVNEGQPSYIEKIDIRGNVKTKDKVIRRELAVSPGEVFNMVAVKRSRNRLEGTRFFEPGKVDARAEPTDPPIVGRKDLVISVEEQNTGNVTLGTGFSSVDSLVGFVVVSQGNFDLFNPPRFTGAGQKLRLRVQLGTERQDYEISFIEPWFLDRKLSLGVDLYHRELNFQSQDDLYDEVRTGGRLSLTRALGSDFLIGSLSYNIENVGIRLDNSVHGDRIIAGGPAGPGGGVPVFDPANAPQAILKEDGYSLLTKVGIGLAYDTRNNTFLPDAGQRTELLGEVTSSYLGGERDFYKLDLSSAWYFRGFVKGHVLEVVGKLGVVEGFDGDDVPFYERFYLGGLYSLRGFRYRDISPREPGFDEPIGGNTYWLGSLEYSIPLIQREQAGGVRFAVFYDIGNVVSDSYDFTTSNFSDNWGFGLRLNLPIGPLRLDYGIPIHQDKNASGSGRFQFGVGWTRPF